ncbi:hypothetical protein CTI12_AA343980 [Artemisia annua]|uniref:RING-type domain-containing protein n=1 Tax=Artemisia annua TaxID=35608 RepID=A0A2U1MT08_ARTAN|nr:hypothetical protein CTI12_AA343980 [Artemisia annua]
MAVQAQFSSDHFQNYNYNNNIGFSNMPQDCVYMNGASVFEDQEQDQKIMNYGNDGYDHNLISSCVVSSSNSRRNGMFGFQNLSSELERQGLEMDCFLHFQQNEKLKALLNEETRREAILMQTYESKMKAILDAKDEVLTTATNRTLELQNYLLMAEKETKNWEKQALANEAMVNNLNKTLNQLARNKKHEEDAESICNGGHDDDARHEKMVCKMCHVRSTCMLMLPCRHLCCCRACEGLVMFCPVCETVKNGSLEVFFGLN